MAGGVTNSADTIRSWFQANDVATGTAGDSNPYAGGDAQQFSDAIDQQLQELDPSKGWKLNEQSGAEQLDLIGQQPHAEGSDTYGADGQLDADEYAETYNQANNAVYALGAADTDKDGQITADEITDFNTSDPIGSDPEYGLSGVLEAMDSNADGTIDNDELNGNVADQFATFQTLTIADTNKDGELSSDEYAAMLDGSAVTTFNADNTTTG
jgi:Ca2+-binding EF-hand superfamily protein